MANVTGLLSAMADAVGDYGKIATKGAKVFGENANGTVKASQIFNYNKDIIMANAEKNASIGSIESIFSPEKSVRGFTQARAAGMNGIDSVRMAYMKDADREALLKDIGNGMFDGLSQDGSSEAFKEAQKALADRMSAAQYDYGRAAWQAVAGVSTGYRIATGGGLYRDKNGEFNVIGVPGI